MKKYSVVIVLAFVWAAYYYSLGISNKLISPFATGVFIRFFTFILLTGLMLATRTMRKLKITNLRLLLLLCSIGCMGFLLDITAFLGSSHGNAATGTILLKTDILMVGLLSALIYKEKLTRREWLLSGVMLVGVFMVLGLNPFSLAFHLTDIFFLLSAFFVSVNAFLIKAAQKAGASNNVIAYYNNFVTMVFFVGAALLSGSMGDMALATANNSLLAALAVGALGQFFIYIFYYRALGTLPVWNVKVILLLIPIITLLYDYVLTGAVPDTTRIIGTLIVLGSAVLVIKAQSQKIRR